jgi:SAM-dependent methyltransferase
MKLVNTVERDYWAGPSGRSWIDHQVAMDELLAPVTELLLNRAGDVAGQDVLDIGCGTGALSRAFADAGSRVLATDISEPLLAHAAVLGGGRFETLLADAEVANWPRIFDVALSRFGVMFFADPAAAFANIRRALSPGGRCLFAAWGPFGENPWWARQLEIAADLLGAEAAFPDPHGPGPMGLSDRDWALERVRASGLTGVGCETVDLRLGGSTDLLADISPRVGPGARLLRLAGADEAARTEYARRVSDAFEIYKDGVPARILLYTARVP